MKRRELVTPETKQKTTAFTLAEVLITLAIIGIVAALTIPTLVQNYQERASTDNSDTCAKLPRKSVEHSITGIPEKTR